MAKIFILDDSKDGYKDLYERVLNTGGHDILYITGTTDILKPLFQFKPDVVVINVEDGDTTNISRLSEVKKHPNFSHTPVLVVLGESQNEINLAMSSGANEYILKPIRETDLTSRISILLNRVNLFNDEFAPGTIFARRYRILSLLGKGGDSTVYQAEDTSQNDSHVALKILKLKKDSENFTAQFERETSGLEKLNHPNIVKLLGHGKIEGVYYVVTEFIKGRNLGDIIKESPLSEESAVELALQVAEVFKYMNTFGIIHRDIKPDNILISDEGEVKVVDFGLSREEHQQTVSIRGEMSGTPQYLAPEYIDGKNLSNKVDIYSLGITLFYMTSGILPFQGRTPMALLNKQLNEPPPVLSETTHGISQEFSDLIGRMLIKNPDERIPLDELISVLQQLSARPS
ncbi:MAG: protein kinase [Victivallales bacterium]|nr:protein kinase [Victivallales bacterium]